VTAACGSVPSFTSLHFTSLHFTSLHFTSLHFVGCLRSSFFVRCLPSFVRSFAAFVRSFFVDFVVFVVFVVFVRSLPSFVPSFLRLFVLSLAESLPLFLCSFVRCRRWSKVVTFVVCRSLVIVVFVVLFIVAFVAFATFVVFVVRGLCAFASLLVGYFRLLVLAFVVRGLSLLVVAFVFVRRCELCVVCGLQSAAFWSSLSSSRCLQTYRTNFPVLTQPRCHSRWLCSSVAGSTRRVQHHTRVFLLPTNSRKKVYLLQWPSTILGLVTVL